MTSRPKMLDRYRKYKNLAKEVYYSPQTESSRVDDGLVPVTLLESDESNLKKVKSDSYRYTLAKIPETHKRGAIIVGNATFLNKYTQLKNIVRGLENGPHYLETRDNKIEVHNSKKMGKPIFSYTYMGGTGELLKFGIQTKYNQSIEHTKVSSIDPDDKALQVKLQQDIPTNLDPCNPQAYIEEWSGANMPNDRDVTYMAPKPYIPPKIVTNDSPTVAKVNLYRDVIQNKAKPKEYQSRSDALAAIEANPSITPEEVIAYNNVLKERWEKYKKELSDYENALKMGVTQDKDGNTIVFPLPPYEVENFVIHRRVRFWVDPVTYKPPMEYDGGVFYPDGPSRYELESKYKGYYYDNMNGVYNNGYKALKADKNITIVDESRGYVLVETELDIPIPGVRIVSDPYFATLGENLTQDLMESVESQIKAKARFVGNPQMESSQVTQISNVGAKYSGQWYAKEVTHTFDSSGYFTEVVYEKKVRNQIVNTVNTSVNLQSVYQKSHEVAKESYKNETWKLPNKIDTELRNLVDKSSEENHYGSSFVAISKKGDGSEYDVYESTKPPTGLIE